jgi:hypothetical protein
MQPKPYSVTPRCRDRLSFVLCVSFAALTLAAFYLSGVLPAYGSLAQCGGLITLTAAVYILARNRIPMTYLVEEEPGRDTYDLVIVRTRAKLRDVTCRLALQDIREIDVAQDPQTLAALKEKYKNDTVHNYCPTLFPQESVFLRFADSDPYAMPTATEEEREAASARVVIRIAPDPTILAMLRDQLNAR